ncbi:hypothetical protein [Micromonospora orduensis]|uniref:hypothetical protein n=1 Tax=Micromonospora orduensis TaxID=1420891 RepID=UPI001ABEF808|nr:hypothetical protein [Micromonospora orduensis]
MPALVTPDARRQPRLLTMLFWAGVGLAPVAALILLVADGNTPLRFAAVLAIVAVVLIGLSIALRPDGDAARADELLDEIEELRRELRAEIVAAAQRGNQALDQAQRAQEGITAVRRRLDASSAVPAGAAPDAAGAGRARVPAADPADDAPAGRASVAADVPAARSRVPGEVPAGRGRVSVPEDAARWGRAEHADEDEPAYPRATAEPPPAGVYGAGVYGGERPAATRYGSARPREHDRPEPAHRPAGVVRHTETVHVTTRHTVVDGGPPETATRYGGGYAGQWTPPAQEWTRGGGADERPRPAERPHGEAEDRQWSGYADDRPGWGADREVADVDAEPGWRDRRDEPQWAGPRDAYAPADEPARGSRAQRDERGWSEQREPDRGSAAPQSGPPLRADDTGEFWSQMRAGDRWAAVRDDEHGRELHVGERRAEVHADPAGTEYRMADRWASVRHEEPRRHEDARRHQEPRRQDDADWYAERESYHRDEPAAQPALPVGGVPVPDEWRPPRQRGHQAEPERVGRRRVEERYGYPPQDDVPRAGGAPPGDHWR